MSYKAFGRFINRPLTARHNSQNRRSCTGTTSLEEKEYYELNKEVIKEHSREWQANNPEKARLQKKKYYEVHKNNIKAKDGV